MHWNANGFLKFSWLVCEKPCYAYIEYIWGVTKKRWEEIVSTQNTRTFSHSDNVYVIMSNYLLPYLIKYNLWVMKDQLTLISLSMSPLVIILAISTITKTHPQFSWNFVLSKWVEPYPIHWLVHELEPHQEPQHILT